MPVITVLIIVVIVMLALLLGLLFSPFYVEADTRVPFLLFRWKGIGLARLEYEGEWLLKWRVFFIRRTVHLEAMQKRKVKPNAHSQPKKKRKKPARKMKWSVLWRMLRTFRVQHWRWVVDTGDYTLNARLFPVNYWPRCNGHVQVNFTGENYLYFSIRNRPWQLIYAWLRG